MSGIGELRRRIALYAPERTPDGAGGFGESWNAAGEYWARIAPLNGGETITADRLNSAARYRVEVRAPNAAQAGWRVFWQDCWHRIESVQAGERPGDRIIFIIAEVKQ